MRILHLIYDDIGNPWLGGGGAVRTLEINRRLAARGHQVIVACGAYPGAPASDGRGGVLYLRLGGHGPDRPPRGYLASRLRFVARAGALLKAGAYDIVIEDVSPYSPVFAPLRARRGAAVVASVQNLSGGHARRKYGYGPRGLVPWLVERPLLRRFTEAIVVSPGLAGELQTWWHPRGGGHVAVIPNGPGPDFAAATPPAAGREEPAILFLGRLDLYQKGLDTLMRGYAAAAPRLPGVRLEMAGSGSPETVARLQALAAENGLPVIAAPPGGPLPAGTRPPVVVLRGRLDGPAAAAALGGCLFLALPSRYEAWPIVAIEAGVCGRPVLGTDVVGVRDAAPPQAHGWLVPADDVEALAEGMVRLAGDPALRQELGARGRAWAAGFTWDRLAAQQEAFYVAALARAAARQDAARP